LSSFFSVRFATVVHEGVFSLSGTTVLHIRKNNGRASGVFSRGVCSG
jgi:hypothetical protein